MSLITCEAQRGVHKAWAIALAGDAESKKRLKTVELVGERTDWTPPAPRFSAAALVPLHIDFADLQARTNAKAAGGRWDPGKKLWFVRYGTIAGTSLEKHIQVDEIDDTANSAKPSSGI